jgi:ATP-dependent Clp protease adaptor protein ClpS
VHTEVETRPDIAPDLGARSGLLDPWSVVLHNDDHNDMVHVVQSLLKSVPTLSQQAAIEVMMEAHNQGKAVVVRVPLEAAELYRDRLQSFGLTATLEKG